MKCSKKNIRIISITFGVVILMAALIGAICQQFCKKNIISQTQWVYIYPGEGLDSALRQLAPVVSSTNLKLLSWADILLDIDKHLKKQSHGGAYRFTAHSSLLEIAKDLRNGHQTPVRVTFNNIRLKEELSATLAKYIQADSTAISQAINDSIFMHETGTDSATVESIFLPDTYEVYWNTSANKLVEKMKKEYNRFWNDDRLRKVKALDITPTQAIIIASIAEEETQNRNERGVVARLYWNRLQCGMPLQADPTIKFALKDFSLTRILSKHLEIDSPYNTYKYAGLPPGPIRIPDKATIDALLNSQPHSYYYMCAKEDFSGLHNFATNLNDHNRNAAKYHRALQNLKQSK